MSNDIGDLMVARRLLLNSEQMLAQRNGKKVKVKSAKEALEEDQVFLSGGVKPAEAATPAKTNPPEETKINLSELISKLKEMQDASGSVAQPTTFSQTTVSYSYTEIEVALHYQVLSPVEGLVVRNKNLAETDRYKFEFQDGATFKITDKWSGKSTTVWGDPHVDTSDQEGNRDGEFSDLKGSQTHTTMMLEDGTRLTFTAMDNGLIEKVDLYKGNQHLEGTGAGSKEWGEEKNLFASKVDNLSDSKASQVPLGDVVYAGGDGNDWFDSYGRMIWGKTTGPKVTSRPAGMLEVDVRMQIEQATLQMTRMN